MKGKFAKLNWNILLLTLSMFLTAFIQSEYTKIRTRKNFVFEHFSRSELSVLLSTTSRFRQGIQFRAKNQNCQFKLKFGT